MRKFPWIQALAKWNSCVIVSNHLSPTFPITVPRLGGWGPVCGKPHPFWNLVLFITKGKQRTSWRIGNTLQRHRRKIIVIPPPFKSKWKWGECLLLAWFSFLTGLSWEGGGWRQPRGRRLLLHFSIRTNQPTKPASEGPQQKWFQKWLTHIGPLFKWKDQRDSKANKEVTGLVGEGKK